MEAKQVKLTMPGSLYKEGMGFVKEFGYSSIQELALAGLRKEVIELKKQQALLNLRKNFRSVKPMPRLTKEEREKIAESSLPRAEKIMKEFGL